MPRKVRVEFAGAVYHVMARGNKRTATFRDDQDRKRFLAVLCEASERFGLLVHAFCLMPNHYHLVIETPRANLSQAMGWVQTTYTMRFNRRHRRVGHLFQGRYKAQLVDAQEYGPRLVRHVHYNPVRPAKRPEPIPLERQKALEQYEWSSHRDYAGLRKPMPWLCLDWLRLWHRNRGEAQRQYRKEMAAGFGKPAENPWEDLRGSLVLGTEKLWRKAKGMITRKTGRKDQQWHRRQGVEEVQKRVRRLVATEKDARLQIWARVRFGGERGQAVAKEFGYRDGSGVTQVVRRLDAAAEADRGLRTRMKELKDALSIVTD